HRPDPPVSDARDRFHAFDRNHGERLARAHMHPAPIHFIDTPDERSATGLYRAAPVPRYPVGVVEEIGARVVGRGPGSGSATDAHPDECAAARDLRGGERRKRHREPTFPHPPHPCLSSSGTTMPGGAASVKWSRGSRATLSVSRWA